MGSDTTVTSDTSMLTAGEDSFRCGNMIDISRYPRVKTKSAVRTFASRDFNSGKTSCDDKQKLSPKSSLDKKFKMSKKRGIGKKQSKVGLDDLDKSRRSCGDFQDIIVHYELYGKPIEMVYDGVHDGPLLGEGVTGLVRQVTHLATGAQYAVKCLDISKIKTEDQLQQLRQEIEIMCRLDHPHIVRLEEVYESEDEIYLIQELCQGGDLFDALDSQEQGVYTERQCVALVKQMLSSLRYLHSKGIVHRDLKLENFLFTASTEDSSNFLHMIDFGLAKHFSSGKAELHDHVGTPYTVAPEVISSPTYDEKCDVWAIGVLTFLLLSGETPFGGDCQEDDLMEVRENILNANYTFYPDQWDGISTEAKDFITQLLVLNPKDRPNPVQCQSHPWLQKFNSENNNNNIETRSTIATNSKQCDGKNHNTLEQKLYDCHLNEGGCNINPHVVKSLMEFQEYSTMQRLLREVLSYTLLPEQIGELKQEFLKIDVQGTGEICYSDFRRVLISSSKDQSEESMRQIFNSLRIPQQVSPTSNNCKEDEPTIHWHEFIAAELSLCHVDEHNIKRAFDRLDYDHKGYITRQNLQDLFCHGFNWEHMWKDATKCANCKNPNQITYHEFLILVKQPKVPPAPTSSATKTTTATTTHSTTKSPTITRSTTTPTKSSKKKFHFISLKGLKCKLHISHKN